MKIRSCLAAIMLLSTSIAQANIEVHSLASTFNADSCSHLAGAWHGTGSVEKWPLIKCEYEGEMNIHNTSLTQFVLDIHLNKTSGAFCPESTSLQIPGYCQDGVIVLKSNDANLQGSLDSSGTEAHLQGSVSFSGITADAKITLQKQ